MSGGDQNYTQGAGLVPGSVAGYANASEDNTGHGHVRPRSDGSRARCGGPGICAECSREAARAAWTPSRDECALKTQDRSHFMEELRAVINRHSVENASHTPDYLLAAFVASCLDAYAEAVTARDRWFDFNPWHRRATQVSQIDGSPLVVHGSPAQDGANRFFPPNSEG